MLDFLMISHSVNRNGKIEVYPTFRVGGGVQDLMVKGGRFYAVWNEKDGLWSTDQDVAISLMDEELRRYTEKLKERERDGMISTKYFFNSDTGSIDKWIKYTQKQSWDHYVQLDKKIMFANDVTSKEDYASMKLPYTMVNGSIENYDKLIGTLYNPEERKKLEWAIGSIIAGDSKKIQKFVVLYGEGGSGKGTFLKIVQKLFDGYCESFNAKQLGSSNNMFAMESFKNNPLVAIDTDGDLSRIEDNTKLNAIVSHEYMEMNEKYKSSYSVRLDSFLFIGSNRPVKITEAKSGLIRRLIDVRPSGNKVPQVTYDNLMAGIDFELGSIAKHCYDVYKSMGKTYYDEYSPMDMMGATNDFYEFVSNYADEFMAQEYVQLKDVWDIYRKYCEYAQVPYPMSMRAMKNELRNYFRDYKKDTTIDGKHIRNVYLDFRSDKFFNQKDEVPDEEKWIVLEDRSSLFDIECRTCFAQYANEKETPTYKWDNVVTRLQDLDTSKLHYVMPPSNHIVVDFDLKDVNGNKSLELNLKAANKWPKTYVEVSKGGQGLHLHYTYYGDVTKLSNVYDEGIEIKVFTGNSSLRRRLSKCNDVEIATISSGLPLKGGKNVVNFEGIKSEKALRRIIEDCLMKKHHGATKPEVDFIKKILDDAYESGMEYDVSDMESRVFAFANDSSHQAPLCLKIFGEMKFHSDNREEFEVGKGDADGDIAFYDVEVFPNLFVVVWKKLDADPVKMINPSPMDIEKLVRYKLVGFNNRRYDNHILYARIQGYSNEQLFDLSQKIIDGHREAFFGGAYNLSYTDIYDFCSKKQSLKKWEIELGIHHQELGLRWDQPVPEDMWELVAEYCINDVLATEAVWKKRQSDFLAREILADVAGMTVNDTTNSLTTRIIVGKEKHPRLNYVDLAETFPGYEFVDGKNMYRYTNIGRGGYIVSWPGIYTDVALLDVASLHPNSIIQMNLFGEYTKNFKDLVDARIAIKHGDYESAKGMLDGKLAKYLTDEKAAKDLAQALKIAINSVYGLTAASFDNPLKDIRNKNNIVALRGALFMRTLQDEVTKKGFKIVAIKTDSIKIANATKEIVEFCMEFAKNYGYTFEHEATYDRICQINDADYVALYKDRAWCEDTYGYIPGDNYDHEKTWTSTGAQFSVPYVFKTLFSHEQIAFEDKCETKSVTTSMYLDMNEDLGEGEHDYQFIGKVGSFCPIKPGHGGGVLLREKDGKYSAVTGTKGYRWLEAETVTRLNKVESIDDSYYKNLVDTALQNIGSHGDIEMFLDADKYYDIPF